VGGICENAGIELDLTIWTMEKSVCIRCCVGKEVHGPVGARQGGFMTNDLVVEFFEPLGIRENELALHSAIPHVNAADSLREIVRWNG
jgi:hypothetical protein